MSVTHGNNCTHGAGHRVRGEVVVRAVATCVALNLEFNLMQEEEEEEVLLTVYNK